MRRLATITLAVCALVPVTLAQQRQPPAPTFKSSVELVHLDVSVLDRARRPVRGLGAEDFTVIENGVPQQIAVFNAVNIPDAPPPSAAWVREIAPDVSGNRGVQDRRLFLIIIDDATIQSDTMAIKNVREVAGKVIDRLGPTDLAAVLFTRDNRNSQDYTSDQARLRTAVSKFTVGFRDMAPMQIAGADDLYFLYSVNVLQSAVKVLGSLPDRRKSIVYIGQGVPVDVALSAASANVPGLPADGGASALSQGNLAARITFLMEDVFRRAAQANVNVYTVDPCGLRAPPGPAVFPAPTCIPGLEVEYLKTVAAATRGRAITDTNNFEPGVAAIFEENASYYLLGYHSKDGATDGKLRRLEVKVNRPGVEVRTRSGYRAETPKEAARRKAEVAASPLGVALSGLLPKSDLPLQMTAVPIAVPGKREAGVAIAVGLQQPLRDASKGAVERVDLQVSAFDVEGRHKGSSRMRADVTIRPGSTGTAAYEVLARIDLAPGRYQLRIAAHVGNLSTSGSLYYDVDVPDFGKRPVALSGIVLNATEGPVAAPKDALRALLPVVPTTRRDFTARDAVTAFSRVYQGGKAPMAPIALQVQLRSATGALVFQRQQDVPVTQFTSARSADILVDVPIARLAPGEYLLTLETTSGGEVVRRNSRFRVLE